MIRNLLVAVFIGALAIIPTVACSGGGGGSTTTVELREWSVVPPTSTFSTGQMTIEARNAGTRNHELRVKRLGGATPQLVDVIETFPAGQTKSKTFTLTPGRYELSCELAEQEGGQIINHYQLGMHTEVTVQ